MPDPKLDRVFTNPEDGEPPKDPGDGPPGVRLNATVEVGESAAASKGCDGAREAVANACAATISMLTRDRRWSRDCSCDKGETSEGKGS